jgi:hypothetical protein
MLWRFEEELAVIVAEGLNRLIDTHGHWGRVGLSATLIEKREEDNGHKGRFFRR